ncbi:MAG: caspase family protein [Gemmataceae bacterium]
MMRSLRSVNLADVLSAGFISAGRIPLLQAQESEPPTRLAVQIGHPSVKSVAISKDGKHVLTTGGDSQVILWEATTGRIVRRYLHVDRAHSAAFSSDEREILVLSQGASRIDAATGKVIASGSAWCSPPTRDGKWMVAGDFGVGKVWLVDASTLMEVRTYRELGNNHPNHLVYAISPDGKTVAAGKSDHSIQIFDVGGKELKPLVGHRERLYSFRFSPDGTRGVSTSADNTIRLWNIAAAKELRRLEGEGVTNTSSPAAFSPDGSLIAVSRSGGTDIWKADADEVVARIPSHLGPHTFSSDGKQLVVGHNHDASGAFILWDVATKQTVQRFESRVSPVTALSFSPDARRLLLRDQSGGMVWDLAEGKEKLRIPHPYVWDVGNARFVGDGKHILISGEGTHIVEAEHGKKVRGLKHVAARVALSPDEKRVAGILQPGHPDTLVVWDFEKGSEVFRRTFKALIANVAFTPDGKHLLVATAQGNHQVSCFETTNYKDVWEDSEPAHHWTLQVVCSPDSKTFAQCGTGRVQLRDVLTGKVLHAFDQASAAAYSADGKRMLLAVGKVARMFDSTTFNETLASEGHEDDIVSVAISPHGKWAATGSKDGTTRLWDAASGKELCKLLASADGTWAAMDADGRFDVSERIDFPGAHWVIGNASLTLGQLKQRSHDSGLIAKVLGYSKEPLRKIQALRKVDLHPFVNLEGPHADGKMAIRLENRGGGIGKVQVLANGKVFLADARKPMTDPDAKSAAIEIDLSKASGLEPGSDRVVEVVAWNKEGSLSSGPIRRSFANPAQGNAGPHVPKLTIQASHEGVDSVAMSKDGKYVLTTGGDANAILWEASTGRIVRRLNHHSFAYSAQFATDDREVVVMTENSSRLDLNTGKMLQPSYWSISPSTRDGSYTAGYYTPNEVHLLDARSIAPIRAYRTSRKESNFNKLTVAISPNGKTLAAGDTDHSIRLWDVFGKELSPLQGHTNSLLSFQFSPDSTLGVSTSTDQTVRLWDIAQGKEIRRSAGEPIAFTQNGASAVFSPDETLIAVARRDWTDLWNVKTGEIVDRVRFDGGTRSFSADGKYLLLGNHHGHMPYAAIWDLGKKEEVRRFTNRTSLVSSVSLSPDMRRLLTRNSTHGMVWDLVSGRDQLKLPRPWALDFGNTKYIGAGKRMLISNGAGVEIVDAESGAILASTKDVAACMAISPDETLVAGIPVNVHMGTVVIRNLRTQQEAFRRDFKGEIVFAVTFTPDGQRLLVGGSSGRVTCFEVGTYKELWSVLPENRPWIRQLVCAPDSKTVIVCNGNAAHLREVATGKLLHEFDHVSTAQGRAAVSPDGKRILLGGLRIARLFDAQTLETMVTFEGHEDAIHSVALSADGKWAITGSQDCTTRIWDVATGKELCKLVAFNDGAWAAIDVEGRFDASNGGDVEGMHWVVGNETIALGQLKERYYDPGLVGKILGYSKEPLRKVDALREVQLHPRATLDVPDADGKLKVRLENRGGGIGKVQVLLNGKELLADARGGAVDSKDQTATVAIDLANAPSLKPGQENVVEVVTWNAEGYLSSRGIQRLYTAKGTMQQDAPELHAIVVGVSEYANPSLNLRYSAKDAKDIASALELGAKKLFGADKSHITLLVQDKDGKHQPPTRANIEKAFAAARSAKPGDVFVVYLAGHGVALPGDSDQYCYLTSDARTADPAVLNDPAVASQYSITGADLTEWIKKVPALKQVMVLDTCAAGAVAKKLTEQRSVSGEQIRAIERLKDRTGFHILMGCASDKVSYEATQFSQGLLTHALLKAMRGAALRENEYVDVGSLFQYAAEQVPRLAKNIGGIQKPLIAAPRGSSFDIGRLTTEEKQRVPLASPLPIVLRPLLINPDEGDDNLGLMPRLRQKLADTLLQTTKDRPSAVFVDSDEMPGGIRPAGTYTTANGMIRMRINLRRDGMTLATFEVNGASSDLNAVADAASAEILKKMR